MHNLCGLCPRFGAARAIARASSRGSYSEKGSSRVARSLQHHDVSVCPSLENAWLFACLSPAPLKLHLPDLT